MLNIIKSSTRLSWQLNHAAITIQRLQNYASFQLRDILYERSSDAGSLLINFAKHIATERHQNSEPIPTTIRYADYFPVSDARYFRKELIKTPADQLAALFIFASTYRSNAHPEKFVSVLNAMDEVAVKQLPNMNTVSILNTLYGLLFFAPHWITRMDFYYAAMKRLADDFEGIEPKEEFVQLCFYLALVKNRTSAQNTQLKHLLKQHLNKYLSKLSTMDLTIVCNAAYKTSTQVESKLYAHHLENAVTQLQLDHSNCPLLITLIKGMRFQRVHSAAVCKRLSEIITNVRESKIFDARGFAHIFAYFAENLWDDEATMSALIQAFLKQLEYNSGKVRAKDIATFTWCCAQLQTKLTIDQLQLVEEILLQKVCNDELKYFTDQLVDACLSLWILGYKSRELLQATIKLKANARQSAKLQPKVDSRLTVLLSAAAIEQPKWVEGHADNLNAFDIDSKVPAYILKNNNELSELAEKLAALYDAKTVKMVMPIHGINIPSVLVDLDTKVNKVFVEYLKPQQMLQFSEQAVSVLRLKVQLLEALGYKVLMLKPNDVQDEKSLKELLSAINCDTTEKQSVGIV